ncbi:MAG TPA: hypothetical protein VKB73_16755 [Gaiellaceae bacterium]|nr:hypothetical protein [Gaiellaceae bacterium]
MRRKGTAGTRSVRFSFVAGVVAALAGAMAASSGADRTYPINLTIREHKAVEFDPGFPVDASPCFVTTADVTEVYNVEVHVLASGIDDQDNLIPPLHVEQTREESLLVVPNDPTIPTYTGHSTAHVRNPEDSPNALSTNTITLHGTDGSQLLMHENVHVLVKANGIDLFVDHAFAHVNC